MRKEEKACRLCNGVVDKKDAMASNFPVLCPTESVELIQLFTVETRWFHS
jgi:hypothetical protein